MRTAGIDIGTTTISAVVMEQEQKRIVVSKTIPNGSFIHTSREWERIQNVTVICERAGALLEELLGQYPDIERIGLTGQMHGILYVNKEGTCISPLYTWQDGRGELPELDGESSVSWIKRNLHLPVAAGYGLVTHFYHCRKGLVPKEAASLCTVADYFGMTLTGRHVPLVHASNAASMGFFDSEKGQFLEELVQEAGMDTALLPEVTSDMDALGCYKGIPVTVAIGDNQAGFLGAVGMEEHTWLLNMGTGGQISVLSDTYYEAPGIEARPFLAGKYLLAGASLCGGRAYAILEKFFRRYAMALGKQDEEQYDIMAKLLDMASDQSDRMNVVTTFKGTRVNPEARGRITNISEDNFTPEGLIRGVLEGMARELYDLYTVIQSGTGIPVVHLVGSGNGLRKNKALQDLFSELFQKQLILSELEEEAACGAAVSCSISA